MGAFVIDGTTNLWRTLTFSRTVSYNREQLFIAPSSSLLSSLYSDVALSQHIPPLYEEALRRLYNHVRGPRQGIVVVEK